MKTGRTYRKDEMKKIKRIPVVTWITLVAVLASMCTGLSFGRHTSAQSSQSEIRTVANDKYPTLSKYAADLTLLALNGKLEPARGFETSITSVIDSLATTSKAPLVLGDSDLDRDAIARGVAFR